MIKQYQHTAHWLLGYGLNSKRVRRETNHRKKKNFLLQCPLFEISSEDLNKQFATKTKHCQNLMKDTNPDIKEN